MLRNLFMYRGRLFLEPTISNAIRQVTGRAITGLLFYIGSKFQWLFLAPRHRKCDSARDGGNHRQGGTLPGPNSNGHRQTMTHRIRDDCFSLYPSPFTVLTWKLEEELPVCLVRDSTSPRSLLFSPSKILLGRLFLTYQDTNSKPFEVLCKRKGGEATQ